jgi:hypothetical protein
MNGIDVKETLFYQKFPKLRAKVLADAKEQMPHQKIAPKYSKSL